MNAKDEFLKHTAGKKVLCAKLRHTEYRSKEMVSHNLCIGYTEKDMIVFLESIDFTYDDGYGGQELFGTIWYEDMSWSERGEYDGSEWWDYKIPPEIPLELFRRI